MTVALVSLCLLVAALGAAVAMLSIRMGRLETSLASKSARVTVLEEEQAETLAALDRERTKHTQLEADHLRDLERLRAMIPKPADSREGAARLNTATRWGRDK